MQISTGRLVSCNIQQGLIGKSPKVFIFNNAAKCYLLEGGALRLGNEPKRISAKKLYSKVDSLLV